MKGPIAAATKRFRLDRVDPDSTPGWRGDKQRALAEIDRLNDRLEQLQELLFAAHAHRLLVVLQAMDTGGKDGAIRRVFDGVNPAGVRVVSFKAPTPVELEHDFLWRIHPHVPARGELVIFNRSHYEDVLIVRVHDLVPEARWRRRYAQIRDFERLLTDDGTTIVKLMLHISQAEQKQRLQERLADPAKQWKFNPGDLKERTRWRDYMAAYQEAIRETATSSAPWYVIPANRKWYRDWAILKLLIATLEEMHLRPRKPDFDPRTIRIR